MGAAKVSFCLKKQERKLPDTLLLVHLNGGTLLTNYVKGGILCMNSDGVWVSSS